MKNITKHNRPINTVLKEYIERQKGKVVEARKELQRRFNGLDWNIQKKILVAHLKSSKSDREWAYSLLLNYWDKSFYLMFRKFGRHFMKSDAHGLLFAISRKIIFSIIFIC